MDEPIDAIYENGVFRPLRPLSLPEGAHARVIPDKPSPESSSAGEPDWDSPELVAKQKAALKWWHRSIREGERLGARLELSRTYFEVGVRLLEAESKFKALNGIKAQEYLTKARVLFEEMDLQWDLDELERVARNFSDES